MEKEIPEFVIFLSTGCLMGITYERWVELATIHAIPGDELFSLVFSVSLISSVLATLWLVLFMTRNGSRIFAETAFVLNVIVVVLWIATVAVSSASEPIPVIISLLDTQILLRQNGRAHPTTCWVAFVWRYRSHRVLSLVISDSFNSMINLVISTLYKLKFM